MKNQIINLIDSIEGFGNLIVTSPDGTIKQKYPFKNTITEHFKRALMSSIIYGDKEEIVASNGDILTHTRKWIILQANTNYPDGFVGGDGESRSGVIHGGDTGDNSADVGSGEFHNYAVDAAGNRPPGWVYGVGVNEQNNHGSYGWHAGNQFFTEASIPFPYYNSNKMIAHQFKVKVGTSGSPSNIINVKKGTANQFNWANNSSPGFGPIGETRTAVIGWIDSSQTTLSYGTSPSEVANDSDAEIFDFGQNVFVGMISQPGAPPGVTEPLFKPARENLRIAEGASNTGEMNIDSPYQKSKSWIELDHDDLKGTKSTVRQSLGAGRWKIASYYTSDPVLQVKYKLGGATVGANGQLEHVKNTTDNTLYTMEQEAGETPQAINRGDVIPADNSVKRKIWVDATSEFVEYSVPGTMDIAFYMSDNFKGDDAEDVIPYDYELDEPNGDFYWSFTSNVDMDVDHETWGSRKLDVATKGKILAIEVQNFPQRYKKDKRTVASMDDTLVEAETLAFHIPTTDIELDRNDNITVEYNFQFTKPTSVHDVEWNLQYIDHLARALNPVGTDERTGLPMQNTNSASRIQLSASTVFEQGVFESQNTSKPDFAGSQTFTNNFENGAANEVTRVSETVVPDSIRKKGLLWGGSLPTNSEGETMNTYLEYDSTPNGLGQPIHRRTTGEGENVEYSATGKWNKKFMRIWTSSEANKYANITVDDTALKSAIDFQDRPNNIDFDGDKFIDKRSYYHQVLNTPDLTNLTALSNNEKNDFFIQPNKFDYFKNLVTEMYDWQHRINFNNRKCQLFLTPHGTLARNMRAHIENTEWLKQTDYRTHYETGIKMTNEDSNDFLYNLETLWQNNARMFYDDLMNLTVDSGDAVYQKFLAVRKLAVDLLYLFDTIIDHEETHLIQEQVYNSGVMDSIVTLKTTTDARFDKPPIFFRVSYGHDGHALPQDMMDDDIQGRWKLRSDYNEILNEKFGEFLVTRQVTPTAAASAGALWDGAKWDDGLSERKLIEEWDEILDGANTPLPSTGYIEDTVAVGSSNMSPVLGLTPSPEDRAENRPGEIDFSDLYTVKSVDEIAPLKDKRHYLHGYPGITSYALPVSADTGQLAAFDKFLVQKTSTYRGGIGDQQHENIFLIWDGNLRIPVTLNENHKYWDGNAYVKIIGAVNPDGGAPIADAAGVPASAMYQYQHVSFYLDPNAHITDQSITTTYKTRPDARGEYGSGPPEADDNGVQRSTWISGDHYYIDWSNGGSNAVTLGDRYGHWFEGMSFNIKLHDFGVNPVLTCAHDHYKSLWDGTSGADAPQDGNYRGEVTNKFPLLPYDGTDQPWGDGNIEDQLQKYTQILCWDHNDLVTNAFVDPTQTDATSGTTLSQKWIFDPTKFGLTVESVSTGWWHDIVGFTDITYINARDMVDSHDIAAIGVDNEGNVNWNRAPFLLHDNDETIYNGNNDGSVKLKKATSFGIYDEGWFKAHQDPANRTLNNTTELDDWITLKGGTALKVYSDNGATDHGQIDDGAASPTVITTPGFSKTFPNLFVPKIINHYTGDFYIAKSLKHGNGANNEPSETDISNWAEGIAGDNDTGDPPLPTCAAVVAVLKSYIKKKGVEARSWSKRTLFNYIKSIAPYGMMDMYEFFDATPDEMRLELPHPSSDMFYGIIENPGGADGMTNIGSYVYLTEDYMWPTNLAVYTTASADAFNVAGDYTSGDENFVTAGESSPAAGQTIWNTTYLDAAGLGPAGAKWVVGERFVISLGTGGAADGSDAVQSETPTWTRGDKLEMTWTINPPITEQVSA